MGHTKLQLKSSKTNWLWGLGSSGYRDLPSFVLMGFAGLPIPICPFHCPSYIVTCKLKYCNMYYKGLSLSIWELQLVQNVVYTSMLSAASGHLKSFLGFGWKVTYRIISLYDGRKSRYTWNIMHWNVIVKQLKYKLLWLFQQNSKGCYIGLKK